MQLSRLFLFSLLKLGAVLLLLLVISRGAFAHEVIPSIADLWMEDKHVVVKIRTSGEAILSGIDLSTVEDTNDSDKSHIYDELRNEEPAILEAQIKSGWDQIAANIFIAIADGETLPLTLDHVEVEPVGNTNLPRFTFLSMSAELSGASSITFAWVSEYGGVILRQQGVENGLTQFLADGQLSDPIANQNGEAKTALAAFVEYIPVGYAHIIPKGLDHILFVVGLFFFSTYLKPLLWQISAFTIAHTVTLAAGSLGVVSVPAAIVEPLIAASIAYVAIENIFTSTLNRWRPLVIFGFGLLHGLGFASVLGEFGLPQNQFIPALIGFNLGVEIGQITIIVGLFLAVGYWFRDKWFYRSFIAIPVSLAIAATGIYWCVERILG